MDIDEQEVELDLSEPAVVDKYKAAAEVASGSFSDLFPMFAPPFSCSRFHQ
jgi:F420-0:gamma-glutamyl ligase